MGGNGAIEKSLQTKINQIRNSALFLDQTLKFFHALCRGEIVSIEYGAGEKFPILLPSPLFSGSIQSFQVRWWWPFHAGFRIL